MIVRLVIIFPKSDTPDILSDLTHERYDLNLLPPDDQVRVGFEKGTLNKATFDLVDGSTLTYELIGDILWRCEACGVWYSIPEENGATCIQPDCGGLIVRPDVYDEKLRERISKLGNTSNNLTKKEQSNEESDIGNSGN